LDLSAILVPPNLKYIVHQLFVLTNDLKNKNKNHISYFILKIVLEHKNLSIIISRKNNAEKHSTLNLKVCSTKIPEK